MRQGSSESAAGIMFRLRFFLKINAHLLAILPQIKYNT